MDTANAKSPRHFLSENSNSSTTVNANAVAKEVISNAVMPKPYTKLDGKLHGQTRLYL